VHRNYHTVFTECRVLENFSDLSLRTGTVLDNEDFLEDNNTVSRELAIVPVTYCVAWHTT